MVMVGWVTTILELPQELLVLVDMVMTPGLQSIEVVGKMPVIHGATLMVVQVS